MKSWLDDIFSIDNLLHSLVAVAFVVILSLLIGLPLLWAVLAAVGLYLREVSQVDWDFTLKGSRHKHLEWIVGSVVGLIAAVTLMVLL
jgi:hypothetical protein